MAGIIDLKTFTDERGNLTVIEKVLPFEIKRVFYIYGVNNSRRGGHRHKVTKQAAIAIQGSCSINSFSDNYVREEIFHLSSPSKCLIIEPQDWHEMFDFSENCILMVFASEYYTPDDYILTPYEK